MDPSNKCRDDSWKTTAHASDARAFSYRQELHSLIPSLLWGGVRGGGIELGETHQAIRLALHPTRPLAARDATLPVEGRVE